MPITLAIVEGRQEDHKFKASPEHIKFKVRLSSIVKPYLKIKTDLGGWVCWRDDSMVKSTYCSC